LIRKPTYRLALAVAASSAFPPVLSPVKLECEAEAFEAVKGSDLNDNDDYTRRVILSDGGVYDNLGLETAWRFDTVLVSDGGSPFETEPKVRSNWASQAARAFMVSYNQALSLRKRALIADFVAREREGAYWGIGTEIDNYGASHTLPVTAAKIAELAALRTRLNPFDESEQCELINWGYAVCDAAVRTHVKQPLLSHDPQWPYGDHALG